VRERDPIRVVHWGLGEAGLAAARLVARRSGLTSVGAICSDNAGKDLGDLIGFGEHLGIPVHREPGAVLSTARPDVTIMAFGSRVDEIGPKVLQAIEAGSNVICLAEEMVYPWAARPDLAESLDELAHAYGVTVLGTGLNPGFVLDTLVLALSACCTDIERIRAVRATALTDPSADVIKRTGVGLSPSEFAAGLERGRVEGHIGFEQSIHLIADALGWQLDSVEQDCRPALADVRRTVDKVRVDPGQAAGYTQSAVGYVGGVIRIMLEQTEQLAPDAEAIQVGDFIDIEGKPNIRVAIQPAIPAVEATAAIAVNMIGMVLQVGPGLVTMADLPVPRAVLGDLREMFERPGPTVDEELARGWHEEGLGGHDTQAPQ